MKKVFKMMALALVAGAMTMFMACDPENPNPDNPDNPNPGVNTEQPGEPVLLDENFDAGMPTGWATADADGDGDTWVNSIDVMGSGNGANGSAGMMLSKSYDNNIGPLEPDNYLITPAITIPNGKYSVSWQVCGQDAGYAHEYYEVLVGTMANGSFTPSAKIFSGYADVAKAQSTWLSKNASLAEFAGQTVYIAFRHCNTSDEFYLDLDNVKVYDNTL